MRMRILTTVMCAAALFVAGRTRTMAEGWDLAAETINSGKAGAKLAELQKHP